MGKVSQMTNDSHSKGFQVKSSYDTKNNNGGRGSESVRLAGQWYVMLAGLGLTEQGQPSPCHSLGASL